METKPQNKKNSKINIKTKPQNKKKLKNKYKKAISKYLK